jgi:hypothetical protein
MKLFVRLFVPFRAALALLTALSGAVPENNSFIVTITVIVQGVDRRGSRDATGKALRYWEIASLR